MPQADESVGFYERAFAICKTLLDAISDDVAYDELLRVTTGLIRADGVHLFLLDEWRRPTLERGTCDLSKEALAEAVKAVHEALERHKKKEELAALRYADVRSLDTDESIALSLVAKVIMVDLGHPIAVLVVTRVVKPFNEAERRNFTSLCLNAASGLARRRAPAGGEILLPEPSKLVAAMRERAKTALIRVPKNHFEKYDGKLLGNSAAIKAVREQVFCAAEAPGDYHVLILGESGTGKELVARAIHDESPRKKKPYFVVNCGGLSETLTASELFGHVKGAFTGATSDSPGVIRIAEGGTLFLDEVADLPARAQNELLRMLESNEVRAVGGTVTHEVDVRIVAATNKDLGALIAEGKFRRDLFERLNVLPIKLPALRDHREDIPILARKFMNEATAHYGPLKISEDALAALAAYDWPGNVRELRQVTRRAITKAVKVRGEGGKIERVHIELPESSESKRPYNRLQASDLPRVLEALEKHEWKKSRAADALGVDRNTLNAFLKRHKVDDKTGD